MNTPPFEKIVIHAITGDGWPVDFELAPAKGVLDETVKYLQALGFAPAPTPQDAKPIQMSPEGLPMCPKHGEVMKARNKQNQTWFSHRITGPDGKECWCKGRRGKDSPGWEIAVGS